MDSALAMAPSSFLLHQNSISKFALIFKHSSKQTIKGFNPSSKQTIKISIKASSNSSSSIARPLKTAAAALIFSAAVFGNFHRLPAKADPRPPPPNLESRLEEKALVGQNEGDSPLTEFLESGSTVSIEAMKAYIEEKLEGGEDELALKILKKLCSAQPDNMDWKFLTATLLSEMGNAEEARELFEEILLKYPLFCSALCEFALSMDECRDSGEGVKVVKILEDALTTAEEEENADAARGVRLMIAQLNFLQKNVEESLRRYDELEKKDPNDFRPAFLKGVIYSLIDKNEEAKQEFEKFRILSPERFDVMGFLTSSLSDFCRSSLSDFWRSWLSRMKLYSLFFTAR